MTISVRPSASVSIAAKLVEDILYKRDIYYVFFGKVEAWTGVADAPVGAPAVSEKDDRDIRSNIAYLKRVMPGEVALVTQKYDWTSGTIYSEWDDTVDMTALKYYVMNPTTFCVYKCLDNANGVASTVEPSGTAFVPFRTSDGYLWKYMYTVPASKRKRFMSGNRLPVQRAFTDSFYSNGSVEKVLIDASGSGYTMLPITSIAVSGTTTGSGADLEIGTVSGTGEILTVTVNAGGTGYTSMDITIAGGGAGAILTPVLSSGVITSVTVTAAGAGYSAGSVITASVGGAVLVPTVVDGSIEEVTIVSPGAGYVGTPTLTVETLNGYSAGTGRYAGNTSAMVSASMLNGRIDQVIINDPGETYDADNATSIAVVGDGTGAVLLPVVDSGQIVDVYVDNPGEGYTSASLNVVGGGTGAVLTAVLADFDLSTDQSIVEQSAIDGGIHLIKVTVPGEGYTNTAEVTIVGDGEGATATATVVSGEVTRIVVTSWGSGYSWATATITDSNRYDPGDLLEVATARVVISPTGGHGINAPKELNADIAAISIVIRDIPAINAIDQEFRQYGMLRNLRQLDTQARTDSLSIYTSIISEFDSTAGLTEDLVLSNQFASFRVVYITGSTVHLLPLSKNNATPVGELTDSTSTTWVCRSISTNPTVDKYSGDLYFTSNEVPFVVDEQQGITIKTYIAF